MNNVSASMNKENGERARVRVGGNGGGSGSGIVYIEMVQRAMM